MLAYWFGTAFWYVVANLLEFLAKVRACDFLLGYIEVDIFKPFTKMWEVRNPGHVLGTIIDNTSAVSQPIGLAQYHPRQMKPSLWDLSKSELATKMQILVSLMAQPP